MRAGFAGGRWNILGSNGRAERSFRSGAVWRNPHRTTLLYQVVDYRRTVKQSDVRWCCAWPVTATRAGLAPLQSFATMEETLERTGTVAVYRSGGVKYSTEGLTPEKVEVPSVLDQWFFRSFQ